MGRERERRERVSERERERERERETSRGDMMQLDVGATWCCREKRRMGRKSRR